MRTNSFAGNTPSLNPVKTLRFKTLLVAMLMSFGLAGFPAPSTSAASFTCNPAELQAKANAHNQKAADYQRAARNELLRNKPSRKKVAYYNKKSKAHTQTANAYRQKVKACEER